MPKILIVDDEADVRKLLTDYFEINGYSVLTARDSREALRKVEQQPDLVLLDINMPEQNGLQLCEKIRHFVTCPILFVTARIEEADKIAGFRAGGDDYILKPFSLRELGARVEAHLRREQRIQTKSSVKFNDDLVIDYTARELYYRNQRIPLAKKEFDIIEFLSAYPGMVFAKERMYENIWGLDDEGDSSVIPEHVRRIRSKFKEYGCDNRIETVWGVGYKWSSS
ncbi:DNA-binding response regulator, OmpR family, contains REC and winged-helix (wHTH) domain [Paenibacillus sp. UNCCL117]|uniref:response regulator transcription factor n=1 Tax=unclassified Paenibacillus TaxID=185978 RepID=UPI00088FA568|nr:MULTISPECIES: response regulator transcription factor [unclassified Paenibacillus]SDC95419.1 DNA-binding response regulator, OmpR family, contains REC and winged-helix (wHTH) domain [Paenibacillus sp. cl123]SFW30038.1 DNA-binding response regulator, OmpR family, contains REC and winged-helix (wHTH) domain [Paenibacillus sp. UNCCL117]